MAKNSLDGKKPISGKATGGRANLKPFPKGKSGNPAGRRPVVKQMREMKQLTAELFQKTLDELLSMTLDDLRWYIRGPTCTALEGLIGGQIISGRHGNTSAMAVLFDRKMGMMARPVELSVRQTITHQIAQKSPEQRHERLLELDQEIAELEKGVIVVKPISVTEE